MKKDRALFKARKDNSFLEAISEFFSCYPPLLEENQIFSIVETKFLDYDLLSITFLITDLTERRGNFANQVALEHLSKKKHHLKLFLRKIFNLRVLPRIVFKKARKFPVK